MVNSMTAFASVNGGARALSWAWEIRSVNGRGLDLKVRIPDGFEPLEPLARKGISGRCKRGSVAVGLKLKRGAVERAASLNQEALTTAMAAVEAVADAARTADLPVAAVDAAAVLALPGVFSVQDAPAAETPDVLAALTADLEAAVEAFCAARAAEGAALRDILMGQIDRIEELCAGAAEVLQGRKDHVAETLRANVARVLEASDAVDEARLAQELALLAVKADVAEELDRLSAHIGAARELLSEKGPIGRKFDFLTQEFNREANTLCSKANFTALTSIGLDLKTVIDQMREQVQNVE